MVALDFDTGHPRDKKTARIRTGRLIFAGLVAGLVLNIGEAVLHGAVLASATAAAYASLNRPLIADPMNLASLIVLTFVQGGLMMGVYAMARPRFSGPSRAATVVGLIAWFLSSVYAGVYFHSGFHGIFPAPLIWVPVGWQLIEFPLAALAGAVTYGE